MDKCVNCGKPLSRNEIGLHKRLINRSAEEYMCKSCLAKYFNVSAEWLDEKIKMYIMHGCTLFSESETDFEDHN